MAHRLLPHFAFKHLQGHLTVVTEPFRVTANAIDGIADNADPQLIAHELEELFFVVHKRATPNYESKRALTSILEAERLVVERTPSWREPVLHKLLEAADWAVRSRLASPPR